MLEYFSDSHGVLLRRDLIAAGLDDDFIYRCRRSGEIVRLRQGVYALAERVQAADRAGRHLLLSHGVMKLYDDRVALSHQSAALVQGAPDWGLDLATVQLTHLFGTGERRAASVTHHRGDVRVDDLSRYEDGWITSPARTAVDTAARADLEVAVCVLDWFLNAGLVTREQLEAASARVLQWPHTHTLGAKVRLADGLSESVGETRFCLLIRQLGLPQPELQWVVRRRDGSIVGRTDFAWPAYGLLGEFDGMRKYLRDRRPGESIEECVIREKRREDELREATGWGMIRAIWADVNDPASTRSRLVRALGLQAA